MSIMVLDMNHRKPGRTSKKPPGPVGKDLGEPLTDELPQVLERLKGSSSERQAAAKLLQRTENIEGYEPLLGALRDSDRETQLIILEALDTIGQSHSKDPTIEKGFDVLTEFMNGHMDDHEVIKQAFDAFQWTGLIDAMCDVVINIRDATSNDHPEISLLANRFYISLYSGDH